MLDFMHFEDMGIPTGYGFKQLLFSPAASVLVLQTCSANDSWRPERLYFRHTQSDRYRPIGNPEAHVSQESPFSHPSKPLLAFVSNLHEFSIDAEGRELHSADWHSLQIINLENGSEIRTVTEKRLHSPVDTVRAWICEIVAFTDHGLFVKAAISKHESVVEYFIAELDLTNTLKPIAALPAVFM